MQSRVIIDGVERCFTGTDIHSPVLVGKKSLFLNSLYSSYCQFTVCPPGSGNRQAGTIRLSLAPASIRHRRNQGSKWLKCSDTGIREREGKEVPTGGQSPQPEAGEGRPDL